MFATSVASLVAGSRSSSSSSGEGETIPIDILANPEKDTERHRSGRCSIARELEVSAAVLRRRLWDVELNVTFRMQVGLLALAWVPVGSFDEMEVPVQGFGFRRAEAVVDLDCLGIGDGEIGSLCDPELGLGVGRGLDLRWRAFEMLFLARTTR